MVEFLVVILVLIIVFLYFKKRKGLVEEISTKSKDNVSGINKKIASPASSKKTNNQRISNNIFKPFNKTSLGNSEIENAIKRYNHDIAYYYIGVLSSGTIYALIIGTSDEWVNVITLNKAKQP